jgi:hypothetical protein
MQVYFDPIRKKNSKKMEDDLNNFFYTRMITSRKEEDNLKKIRIEDNLKNNKKWKRI